MHCPLSGGPSLTDQQVIPPELISEWALAPAEVAYIDRQQGTRCRICGANLSSQVLGDATLSSLHMEGPLAQALRAVRLDTLEINAAGDLHSHIASFDGLVLA